MTKECILILERHLTDTFDHASTVWPPG